MPIRCSTSRSRRKFSDLQRQTQTHVYLTVYVKGARREISKIQLVGTFWTK